MPQKYLEAHEQLINRSLKRNTLVSGIFAIAGFSLLIPAFSLEGTKFDYQEFCFRPPVVHSADVQYCTGEKIRRGVAWRVALERATNQEFQSKVTLLSFIPAQNPNAGVYGLCGAAFFGAAFFFFKHGTEQLESNLDVVVGNKKALVLERALEQGKHLNIQALKVSQEEEFVKEIMNREHGDAMYSLMSDEERLFVGQKQAIHESSHTIKMQLQTATIQAQIAEQLEKEARHKVEIEKLNRPAKTSKTSSVDADANDEVKQELVEKLKAHEDGWLYTVVHSNKPIFLIGSQGSWKSYFCATVALCRYYLKGQKIASIVDPHFNKNAEESWKELLALEPEVYGGAQDWEEVNVGIQEGFNRWAKRTLKDEALTSIWDEATNWAKHEECARSAEEFMGRVLSDPRKSNEGPLVITHAFSNAGTGGGGGFKEARDEGVIQVRLNSDNDQQPLFKGKLLGFKDEEGELIPELRITIPKEWFNPSAVRKMFEGKGARAN